MHRRFKYLLILPPLFLCILAVRLCHTGTDAMQEIPAVTEEDQHRWLAAQGIQAERIRAQTVTIPQEFTGNYADYAALQKQQQLPLSAYAGKQAACVTYEIRDSVPPMYTELLIADGILIGAQCYVPENSITLTMQGTPFTAPTDAKGQT